MAESKPLWTVMRQAERSWGVAYSSPEARVLRAIADEAGQVQERLEFLTPNDVIDWLFSEADRAEAGEVE